MGQVGWSCSYNNPRLPEVSITKGNLIDGLRRLKAWEQLGRPEDTIERFVINLQEILRGEYVANTERKDFLPSEAFAIKRAIEEMEKQAARKRQEKGWSNPRNEKGQYSSSSSIAATRGAGSALAVKSHRGKARDATAASIGIGHTKLYEAEQVVKKAEADPAKYGEIAEEMDRTGNVYWG